jgi:hypothetical protein
MRKIVRRLSLPHLVAVLAVALVLGSGSAYAAKQISGKNIKNNSVTTKDIKDASLTGADVGDGSLSSLDILDGTLTGADVKDASLTGVDVTDGSLASVDITDSTITTTDVAANTLTADDLASGSVGQPEIATDGVGATEIVNDSIDSGEIIDFGLSNQDVGVLFAQVSAAGVLDNSSGSVTTAKIGTGTYEVDFGRVISSCAFTATVGPSGSGSAEGQVNVADRGGNTEAVFVNTEDAGGTNADLPFQLVVVC